MNIKFLFTIIFLNTCVPHVHSTSKYRKAKKNPSPIVLYFFPNNKRLWPHMLPLSFIFLFSENNTPLMRGTKQQIVLCFCTFLVGASTAPPLTTAFLSASPRLSRWPNCSLLGVLHSA